jgi:prevent-host-death family protein
MAGKTSVGVRELRQNLSVYLRRVLRGEAFEVTDRGRPVAVLTPLPDRMEPLARLVAEGRARPATDDLRKLGPPLKLKPDVSISDALQEQREDRI